VSERARPSLFPLAFIAFVVAIFVPKVFWPDAAPYRVLLTAPVLSIIASTCKIASLGAGCAYGLKVVQRTERENPARSAWLLFALWLGCFAGGQIVLSAYQLATGHAPLPSAADAFFFVGYALMIAAGARFVVVYRASGYPVGTRGEAIAIAGGAALVFAIAGVGILLPIATAPVPWVERAVNIGYPVLDFASLVPTVLLLRITSRFRGGRVWSVWASLLVGFAFAAAADILFAYATSSGSVTLDALLDPLFAISYFFLARGAVLQYRLITR
jgi:hypothetical protein